jgi:hypothetical protein
MQAITHEIKKLGSLALFFLIGFGYILLVRKLFLKDFSLDGYVITKAIVGALFAAKAVAIMDITPLINRFREYPRYIELSYKTFLYTLLVMVLGALERFIHAYRETKAMAPAMKMFFDSGQFNQFLATILCIAVVFFIYNVLREIDTYLGKGTLQKMFFSREKNKINRS